MNEYALYKGEKLLYVGTAAEIAKAHGIRQKTVYYYTTPAYKKKMAQRKGGRDYISIVRLDDEE